MPTEAVVLSEPDAGWPAAFETERARLLPVLAPWLSPSLTDGVVHIGSTAIPGLAAKPVLDVMAGVADLDAASAAIDALGRLGYRHGPHRVDALHFHRPGVNLHLTEPDSALWRERLAFRDALRSDGRLVVEYGDLKRALALAHPHDLGAYTAAKRSFVRRILHDAGVELTETETPLPEGVRVRAALIGQWQALAEHAQQAELGTPTRLEGWTTAELLAHLAEDAARQGETDYLRTRCVEAVVHGLDLEPALEPEPAALDVAVRALLDVLADRAPQLVTAAAALPAREWVEVATGRRVAPEEFAGVLPLTR